MKKLILSLLLLIIATSSYSQTTNLKKATFGMGCFWCTEAVFKSLKGVSNVKSGYAGGHLPNPTYEEVTTGETGHAEVIEFTYNPSIITYNELLEVFWKIHDPTTLNRQGADIGTQYRSVIFYHDKEQKNSAEKYKKVLNETNVYGKKVVTEITAAPTFYIAENYHQDYYRLNKELPYCKQVILPKLKQLETLFKSKLKSQ